MKQKAIAVYLDDSNKMEEELSWLYKTWILYSLEKEFDLIVYYNPTAENRIKNFPGVYFEKMSPIRMADKYKFLNSHYFCKSPYSDILKKYKYLLKTDCDVFLTKNMRNFYPSCFLVGQGGYYDQKDDKKISFIKKIAKELNLSYNHMPNIGASYFGETNQILYVVSLQSDITEHLLDNHFKTNDKIDPDSGFHVGISSMIGGEIAINHCFNNQHVNLYTLDSKCWKTSNIGSDVTHIHAWHTSQPWSKHAYFRGEYKDWIVTIDDAFDNAANYCHWIATTPLDKILKYKNHFLFK